MKSSGPICKITKDFYSSTKTKAKNACETWVNDNTEACGLFNSCQSLGKETSGEFKGQYRFSVKGEGCDCSWNWTDYDQIFLESVY